MQYTDLIFLGLLLVILSFPRILKGYKFIMERIAPRIVIEASPDNFVFDSGKSRLQLKPILYFNNEQCVVAIGQEWADDAEITKVELFKCNHRPEQIYDQAMALEAFLRYGIWQVKGNSLIHFLQLFKILRPIVVFKGIETFSPLLCGYQKYIFNALLADLTLKVVYE